MSGKNPGVANLLIKAKFPVGFQKNKPKNDFDYRDDVKIGVSKILNYSLVLNFSPNKGFGGKNFCRKIFCKMIGFVDNGMGGFLGNN